MENKVSLVTGAAKGIGSAIALRLARDGYDVAINYHSHPEEAEKIKKTIESYGRKAMTVYADMASLSDIRAMYDEVLSAFGHVDLVVNNAGISSEVYFLDASEEDFDRMTAIDWKGLYFSSQAAARSMIDRNIKGVIINISSNQKRRRHNRCTQSS